MNGTFLKNYKALILGGISTIVFGIIQVSIGSFIYVSSAKWVLINVLSFLLFWIFLSFLIHTFSAIKILGLLALLLVATVADYYMKVFNPISIPSLLLFWLGVTYLIIPQFFKKYQIVILSVYGAVLCYFFVTRLLPNFREDHLQNLFSFVLIPIPVFAVLWGYEHWRWLKTLESDKAKAELTLLKSQINPHFFFNTLNNLYGLAIEKSDQAPDVILKLSDMMRYTIYEGEKDLVPLKDEIKYLENYIDLHKIRYQKEVELLFNHNVEEGLKVAPLLFIILLENAFKHGVEKMSEHAFIHMEMLSIGKQLKFSITNSFDGSNSNEKQGIGLQNLKKRLEYIYPNQHELKIEDKKLNYQVHLNLDLI